MKVFKKRLMRKTSLKIFCYLGNIHRYLAQIENRPAFNNALIKGQWSASTFNAYWTTA